MKILRIMQILIFLSSCQRNVEIIESGFRFDPKRYEKVLPRLNALNGELQELSNIVEGDGNGLSPDDLATFEIKWTLKDHTETEYLTIDSGGGVVNRNCEEELAPSKKCPPMPDDQNHAYIHPLNSTLRHVFNGRMAGTTAKLIFGNKQSQAWNQNHSNPPINSHYAYLDTKLLSTETLSVSARLISACYPKWERVTTVTYSIPAMTNRRVIQNFLECGTPTMPNAKKCFLIFCSYTE
jgi:hypothetical protein